jgi:hypothetical protein
MAMALLLTMSLLFLLSLTFLLSKRGRYRIPITFVNLLRKSVFSRGLTALPKINVLSNHRLL